MCFPPPQRTWPDKKGTGPGPAPLRTRFNAWQLMVPAAIKIAAQPDAASGTIADGRLIADDVSRRPETGRPGVIHTATFALPLFQALATNVAVNRRTNRDILLAGGTNGRTFRPPGEPHQYRKADHCGQQPDGSHQPVPGQKKDGGSDRQYEHPGRNCVNPRTPPLPPAELLGIGKSPQRLLRGRLRRFIL
jgi:hypothetical protein